VKAVPFTATDVRDAKRTRQFASVADIRGAEECPRLRWRALSVRDPHQRGRGQKVRHLHDREHAQAGAL